MTQFGQNPPSPMPVRLTSSARSAFLTYEIYYGLRERPFSISPDPKFLYKSKTHAPTFNSLLAGIRRREGLIVLTGDIGTGKTTLCRAVLQHLDQRTFTTFVPDPFVSREDLLKMMLLEFGAVSVDDLKLGRLNGASRLDLSYRLYEFLRSLVPLQAVAVLILDEAQNLSLPLLEEVRILSDFESPEKLLQVVLVGQLELRTKLKLPEMRQLDQRVSVRCQLDTLTSPGVAGYITHRLEVAGGAPDRVAFSVDAIDLVDRMSGGVPRVINLICDRALHLGHIAHRSVIDADMVRDAAAELGITPREAAAAPPAAIPPTATPPAAERARPVTAERPERAEPPDRAENVERPEQLIPGSEKHPEPIVFDEHVLQQADPATPMRHGGRPVMVREDAASEAAAVFAAADRPLLVETQGWNADFLLPKSQPFGRGTRRLLTAMSVLIGLGAILMGASYVVDQLQEIRTTEMAPLPEAPPKIIGAVPVARVTAEFTPLEKSPAATTPAGAPDKPAPANAPVASAIAAGGDTPASVPVHGGGSSLYAIDVALFSTAAQAGRAVEQLAAKGYRAYQTDVNLGTRGVVYEVLVGVYTTREAAELDLGRIHELADYKDARVTAAP